MKSRNTIRLNGSEDADPLRDLVRRAKSGDHAAVDELAALAAGMRDADAIAKAVSALEKVDSAIEELDNAGLLADAPPKERAFFIGTPRKLVASVLEYLKTGRMPGKKPGGRGGKEALIEALAASVENLTILWAVVDDIAEGEDGPCEVDDCDERAHACPCGNAHCEDHPHVYLSKKEADEAARDLRDKIRKLPRARIAKLLSDAGVTLDEAGGG